MSSLIWERYQRAEKQNRLGVGVFFRSKTPDSLIATKFLFTIRFMRSLNNGLFAAISCWTELRSSKTLEPNALALINKQMFNYQILQMDALFKAQPFTQYQLTRYASLLSNLQPNPAITTALAQGCFKRNSLKLYKGIKYFVEDLQAIVDYDKKYAPACLKELKVLLSKDDSIVLTQCNDCGRYMPPFRYCIKCQNAHFCSQACDVRGKLSHQGVCRPRGLPGSDAALQVQIHVGGDLGREVEVYYQHQLRMSLKMRGEQMMNKLFQYFLGEGRQLLSSDCTPQILNGHLRMRFSGQKIPQTSSEPFVFDSMDKLCSAYTNNPLISHISVMLIGGGALLSGVIREVHNNHVHLIYIFLCC